ncbi:hypothetical protein [Rubellimicrobium aerolatum]|uniref:Flagellar motor protein MotB n=1 Tax=Rubellimicrobium aerolatum TaxID=490979 RepID=A0ABW0SA81_9RHOB|nr:hypothetical protein [Rubellimicrobium aerolatum]MBP1805227.1 hypothetical protein [Rubellimicrobium aerolatum]
MAPFRSPSTIGRPAGLAAMAALCGLLPALALADPSGGSCAPAGPCAASASPDPAPEVGLGFSISIEGATPEGEPVRQVIAGDPAPPVPPEPAGPDPLPPDLTADLGLSEPATPDDLARAADRRLAAADVQLRFDGLGVRPRLDVAAAGSADGTVTFRASSNYPAWIKRAEILIRQRGRPGRVIAEIPIAPNGEATWTMPPAGPARLDYVLRVYDGAGRHDETVVRPLEPGVAGTDPSLPGEGEGRIARRGIPLRGGAVTLSGEGLPPGTTVTALGGPVPVDPSGRFVVQRVLPPGDHEIAVTLASPGRPARTIARTVTIPRAEWFATGIADVTLGRGVAEGGGPGTGRLAAFADGWLADGTRVTASADTGEGDLDGLLRRVGRKDPDAILRGIEPDEVFAVTGDDSATEELAPSRDGLYLRVENGPSHLMHGDFQPLSDPGLSARTDRTLTGIEGSHGSRAVTRHGEERLRLSAFAARPDTLSQRDVLRGTGGSAYVLGRQDIEDGTEVLTVELRDPVSGRLVESRRLVAGTDYRIEYLQGVVLLAEPLAPSASRPGLVSDAPGGDLVVNLVARYEYVPTNGEVGGLAAGARAEAWVTDGLRLGASALSDDSGLAAQRLLGLDLLLRRSDETWAALDWARSEGPGFGSTLSVNGGLRSEEMPSAGRVGLGAQSIRLEGRADLAEIGLTGHVEGFLDRKEAGFSSPDQEVAADQVAAGIGGTIALRDGLGVTFGAERFDAATGEARRDVRLGLAAEMRPRLALDAEVLRTERADPDDADGTGRRTDIAARLTWIPDAATSYALFAQATLGRRGLPSNDRLGLGLTRRLTDALAVEGEVSGGSAGPAAAARIAYEPSPGTRYSLGYRTDPAQADGTGLVLGMERPLGPRLTARAETAWGVRGDDPSVLQSYGVTFAPDETWAIEGGLLRGRSVEAGGTELRRTGVSLSLRRTLGEELRASLRAELRRETSDGPMADDRTTWLLAGSYDRRTSPDWRLLADLDLLFSDADEGSFLDGRYAEARLGYAFRPADHDRINALFSYTFLYDMPGPDQVNVDGDAEGDRQRSHILNAIVTCELGPRWTLSAKYGFRRREQASRAGGGYDLSTAHLAAVRLDYHLVHDWDLMAEMRAMILPGARATDRGAVLGLYRHVGRNIRLGVGYEWGRVSDDLRRIEGDREGFFVNITASF